MTTKITHSLNMFTQPQYEIEYVDHYKNEEQWIERLSRQAEEELEEVLC